MRRELAAVCCALAAGAGAAQCGQLNSSGPQLVWDSLPVLDGSAYVTPDAGVEGGLLEAEVGAPTGSPCTSNGQCAGVASICREDLFATDGAVIAPIPGGMCSSRCTLANNDPISGIDPECPGTGTCTTNYVLGDICYAACSDQPGSCARPGFACFYGGGAANECFPIGYSQCDPTVAGSCPPGEAGALQGCYWAGPDPVGSCGPGCHPLAQDCTLHAGSPTGCYPNGGGDGICLQGGDAGALAPCVYANDCSPGDICSQVTEKDGATPSLCVPFCGSSSNVPCEGGLTCDKVYPSLGICVP